MLTDKDKLCNLFDEFGIEYSQVQNVITIEAKTKGVEGYGGFVTDFSFDENGKFIIAGVWE
jgi:hypothetical protein